MNLSDLNLLAIAVAGVAKFLIGGLWFSPVLFVKPWLAEMKFTEEQMNAAKAKGPAHTLVPTFFLGLIQVFALAVLLRAVKPECIACAVGTAVMCSVAFSGLSNAINYLFEGRSLRMWLITAGHDAVALAVAGIILGAWPK